MGYFSLSLSWTRKRRGRNNNNMERGGRQCACLLVVFFNLLFSQNSTTELSKSFFCHGPLWSSDFPRWAVTKMKSNECFIISSHVHNNKRMDDQFRNHSSQLFCLLNSISSFFFFPRQCFFFVLFFGWGDQEKLTALRPFRLSLQPSSELSPLSCDVF